MADLDIDRNDVVEVAKGPLVFTFVRNIEIRTRFKSIPAANIAVGREKRLSQIEEGICVPPHVDCLSSRIG